MVRARLGEPPPGAKEDDPRRVVAETIGYVRNNRERMDYPTLPAAGAADQQRAGGEHDQADEPADQGEREVLADGGAEAVAQVRAAYLSEDDRVDRYWARPRRGRAVGSGRLGRPPAKAPG